MYSINKKKPLKIRRYLIYPIAEGIFLAIFALFLTSITAYFIYHHALAAIRAEIKDGLLRTASGIAACLDGDQILSFDSAEKKDLPEYLATVALLQKARLATKHCTYLYINRLASNSVVFIVDPTPIDENGKPLFTDEKNLEPSIPMNPYPGASLELTEALNKHVPTVSHEAYTDQWGTFYSAYVPIFDREKRFVGTLGADLRIDDMLARCKPIEDATKRAFFVSCVLALLFGTLIWFTRRFSLQLNQSRFVLLENYEIASEFADGTSARIGRQLSRTAKIVSSISQRLNEICNNKDSDDLKKILLQEQTRLVSFAEKLQSVGELKSNKRDLELSEFKIQEVEVGLKKHLGKSLENVTNLSFNIDKEIPEVLYGLGQTYEELLEQMGQFFLKMFSCPVVCKIELQREECRGIVLRQTMSVDLKSGIDERRLVLLQSLCKEVESEDFFEEIELAEAVSVSIVRELIYLINSDIEVKMDGNLFSIRFDSEFQKSLEEEDLEE